MYWKRLEANLRPTMVYDTFWRFAAERQKILAKRLRGSSLPWSDDQILLQYRFTNVYRASDRVSQYLIRNVIYRDDPSPQDLLFRILIFKFFNRIETWELLKANGIVLHFQEFDWGGASAILEREIRARRSIYSGAYIMPPGPNSGRKNLKHVSHLDIIRKMAHSDLVNRLMDAPSMADAYSLLRHYPLMGPFLAYQLVTDINYSRLTSFDEMHFTVAGPGARSGIQKCFSRRDGVSDEDIIKLVTERQAKEFKSRGLLFTSLWGRPLQLIDVQNLFCEVDKYSRVKHPNILGLGERNRIKRRFTPRSQILEMWLPPKWGLNERIKERPYL
ncbi:MAG TPA: nucleotide kinase domain-containing protein [Candidatus Binatia bacterium]